jgi:hypothetical protein
MQSQTYDSRKPSGTQAPAGYSKVRTSGGRGEGMNSATRYLTQLQNLLQIARRQDNARVIFALLALIDRRRGLA